MAKEAIIKFFRKSSGVGSPGFGILSYGEPATDTDGNIYLGDTLGNAVQIAQKGAFLVVADDTSRDNIPTTSRREGMLVSVVSSVSNGGFSTLYRLEGGITNGDWTIFTSGGGSGNLTLPVGWTAQGYGLPDDITPTSVLLRVTNTEGDFEVELSLIPVPPVLSPDFTIDFESGW